jgi:hypothetical protein
LILVLDPFARVAQIAALLAGMRIRKAFYDWHPRPEYNKDALW